MNRGEENEKKRLKIWKEVLILILLVVVAVGCSSNTNTQVAPPADNESTKPTAEEGTPQRGGQVIWGSSIDVSTWDPIKASSGGDNRFLWPVYDTLIKITPELEPIPGLAESWDYPDDVTLVLTLVEGVTFHDGTVFDAEAVKFNIERINSEDSIFSDLKSVESVDIIDERTVQLNLSQPDSGLLLALADRMGMMVSPTAVQKYDGDLSRNPVGAGPFKVAEHITDGEVVYEAFEDYWQEGKPYLDKIIVKVMPEGNTRMAALKSGEIDAAFNISTIELEELENNPEYDVHLRDNVPFHTLYLNAALPPFDNKAVRQAINYAINREELIQAIFLGYGTPSSQPFPPDYWAAHPDFEIPYDPEKAKQLLKEAGMENPTVSLTHYSIASSQRFAEAIASQLSEVGFNVELQAMEVNASLAKMWSEKDTHLLLSRWGGRSDPQSTMRDLFGKDSYYNAGSHSTEEIEALIAEAGRTYDMNERAKLYAEITEKGVLEEAVIAPLAVDVIPNVTRSYVKGFENNMLGKEIIADAWREQ